MLFAGIGYRLHVQPSITKWTKLSKNFAIIFSADLRFIYFPFSFWSTEKVLWKMRTLSIVVHFDRTDDDVSLSVSLSVEFMSRFFLRCFNGVSATFVLIETLPAATYMQFKAQLEHAYDLIKKKTWFIASSSVKTPFRLWFTICYHFSGELLCCNFTYFFFRFANNFPRHFSHDPTFIEWRKKNIFPHFALTNQQTKEFERKINDYHTKCMFSEEEKNAQNTCFKWAKNHNIMLVCINDYHLVTHLMLKWLNFSVNILKPVEIECIYSQYIQSTWSAIKWVHLQSFRFEEKDKLKIPSFISAL